MREVKFRGLDMFTNKWVYGLPYREGGEGQWLNIQMENGISVVVIEESVGEFTGLKDKNDREIYEGDILECITFDMMHEKIKVIVEYKTYRACYIIQTLNHGGYYNFSAIASCEIIGNIYENSYLLEGAK